MPLLLSSGRRPDVITDLDEETAEEKAAGEKDDPSFFLRGEGEGAEAYARRVFQRVFCDDIQRILRMDVRPLPASRHASRCLQLSRMLHLPPSLREHVFIRPCRIIRHRIAKLDHSKNKKF